MNAVRKNPNAEPAPASKSEIRNPKSELPNPSALVSSGVESKESLLPYAPRS